MENTAKKSKVLNTTGLIWLVLFFALFFMCACEDSPSQPALRDDIIQIFGEEEEEVKKKRKKRRRSSGSSISYRGSQGGSGGGDDDDDDVDDVGPVSLAQLNQISFLMASGNYAEASRLSRGISPQLSALIEAGDYTGASLLLSQILASTR